MEDLARLRSGSSIPPSYAAPTRSQINSVRSDYWNPILISSQSKLASSNFLLTYYLLIIVAKRCIFRFPSVSNLPPYYIALGAGENFHQLVAHTFKIVEPSLFIIIGQHLYPFFNLATESQPCRLIKDYKE